MQSNPSLLLNSNSTSSIKLSRRCASSSNAPLFCLSLLFDVSYLSACIIYKCECASVLLHDKPIGRWHLTALLNMSVSEGLDDQSYGDKVSEAPRLVLLQPFNVSPPPTVLQTTAILFSITTSALQLSLIKTDWKRTL